MRILLAVLMAFGFGICTVQADTVRLKNGTVVEGKVMEQTAEAVKVDIGGVNLTYYADEVDAVVMGQAPVAPASPQPAAQPQASAPVTVVADGLEAMSKDQLIRKFVEIYGVKENMQANFNQMTSSLTSVQAQAFNGAIRVDDIVEQLLPVYDKHFSENDLKAYIRFYASPEGKKLVSSLPLLMKDSVEVSMKYLDAHLPESLKQPQSSGN